MASSPAGLQIPSKSIAAARRALNSALRCSRVFADRASRKARLVVVVLHIQLSKDARVRERESTRRVLTGIKINTQTIRREVYALNVSVWFSTWVFWGKSHVVVFRVNHMSIFRDTAFALKMYVFRVNHTSRFGSAYTSSHVPNTNVRNFQRGACSQRRGVGGKNNNTGPGF